MPILWAKQVLQLRMIFARGVLSQYPSGKKCKSFSTTALAVRRKVLRAGKVWVWPVSCLSNTDSPVLQFVRTCPPLHFLRLVTILQCGNAGGGNASNVCKL